MTHRIPFTCLGAAALMSGAFAQNDDCSTAIAVTVGSVAFDTTTATASAPTWPCASGGAPDLWYSFTATNDASYTFDTCGSTYDTAIELFDGTCTALNSLSCNDDSCGLQSSLSLGLMPGDSVFVRVGGWSGSTGAGTLNVSEVIIPPPSGSVAAWLTAVGAGTPALYTNSNVPGPIVDNIGVPTGASGVTYEFVVYGDNAGASSGLMGVLGPASGASAGLKFEQWPDTMQYGLTEFGVVDHLYTGGLNAPNVDVHLAFVADTTLGTTELFVDGVSFGSVPSAPVLEGDQGIGQIYRPGGANVDVMALGRIRGVAVYDAMLSLGEITAHRDAYFSGSLGTRYCSPAVVNSTGASASVSASGSSNVAANMLTLGCGDMPTASFGFFLTSQTQGMVGQPGGSLGVLCLGGAIGRYVGPGQIQNSGSAGEISLLLDLTMHPTPTGLVTVQPGETWNFQAWFRDAVGGQATSNFSDGVSITFQ